MKMRFFIKMAVVATTAYGVSPAFALTVEEAEAKLRQLEVEREADQNYLKNLKKEVRALEKKVSKKKAGDKNLVPIQVLDDVNLLEKKIKKVDAKSKKRIASVKKSINREKERFRVNGFMSAGVLYGEDEHGYGTLEKGIDFGDEYNFKGDSVIALQVSYKLNDKFDVVTQMAAPGYEEFEIKSEWAFIKYHASDSLNIRVGRLRLPFYLFSESLEVGFTYPWVRPPIEVYINEITSYEGVDFNYRFSTGDWINTLQLSGGSVTSPSYQISDYFGLVWTGEMGSWTARLAFTQADVEIKIPEENIDTAASFGFTKKTLEAPKTNYYAAALMYDDGQLQVVAEATELYSSTGGVASFEAHYISAGYRIGKFMPYGYWAIRHSTEKNDKTPFEIDPDDPNVAASPFKDEFVFELVATSPAEFGGLGEPSGVEDNDTIALGVRYELTNNIALKLEAATYLNFGYETVNGVQVVNNGALQGDEPRDKDSKVSIYSFVVDAVF